ncbi:MAG: Fic/DOC family N-terminal domain-containing protein [Armatimonadota bacterium]
MTPYVPEKLPLPQGSIDWAEHVTLIGKSNAALARYDGILQAVINPQVLLSPLMTQEAVVSSKIEGTVTSMEEVLQFEINPSVGTTPRKHDELHEVINYRQAIKMAVGDMNKRPICLNLVLDLHSILLSGSVRGQESRPGEIRRTQNYIAPQGTPIERATFIPPAPTDVIPALNNWESYVHAEERDSLVQLAILKAQFELIHPFCDGNGRIGRMLVPLLLYGKGLLSSPMFYISAYLERNRDTYFDCLRSISQNNDWNRWIKFFLQAVLVQAEENNRKARAIISLYNEMKVRVPEITHSQFAVQTLDALFDKPIFDSRFFVSRSGIPPSTAKRIIKMLVESEILFILREQSGRTPATLYFPALLEIAEGI